MNKRVHQIAKERGLAPKEVLERLNAAGLEVKAASSSVDEAQARRILGDGDGDGDGAGQKPAPAAEKPARSDGEGGRPRRAAAPARGQGDAPARGQSDAPA